MKGCWQSGFDSLVEKRTTMHHWHALQHLRNQSANREAAAIVESFQVQMDCESCQQDQRLAS